LATLLLLAFGGDSNGRTRELPDPMHDREKSFSSPLFEFPDKSISMSGVTVAQEESGASHTKSDEFVTFIGLSGLHPSN
jgi:quercetin dioxygenase-like cupin family protein